MGAAGWCRMNMVDELDRWCRDIDRRAASCVSCADGRPVAGGNSYVAKRARIYQLCGRCYNTPAIVNARRAALGLGPTRRPRCR
jgi:hypothetical protein